MKEITFASETFILHPSGLLLWPDQSTAIVADLHLEKASYYAARGQFLPPHETEETLQNLLTNLEFSAMKKVIFLGDSFHDLKGYERLNKTSKKLFDKLCEHYEILWVEGNHDASFVPPNIKTVFEERIRNITLRHIAEANATLEISGHYHPKAQIHLKGQRINRACFIEDGNRFILPAYGSLTGGLDIKNKVISELFSENFTAHLLGNNKIYSIPSNKF